MSPRFLTDRAWTVAVPALGALWLGALWLAASGGAAHGASPGSTAPLVGYAWVEVGFGLLGGLALFLYGMRLMSEGMRNVFGDRMRALLGTLTRSRLLAVAVGALMTMIIQSSSATTVMLVGFVQAQLMTFAQTMGLALGARIGTTITAQIIAFRLADFALPVIAAGFAAMLLARNDLWRNVGQGALGFGLLFFGMKLMTDALAPLSGQRAFMELMLAPRPALLGALIGALLTALVQSSSAFTGVLIVLATQGLLTLHGAIPLILGANVGTSITAVLAALNARREAQRVAIGHALVSVIGLLLALPLVDPLADLVRWLTSAAQASALATPRQVANAHTVYNLLVVLAMLPVLPWLVRVVTWLRPDSAEAERGPYRTVYLDEAVLGTPAFALKLARAEATRMGQLVLQMAQQCVAPFLERRVEPVAVLRGMEAEVNFLRQRIDDYLARIGQRNLTAGDIDEAFQLMYAATELEQIADIVTKSILPRSGGWLVSGRRFSAPGQAELRDMHLRAVKQIARALNLLRERSPRQADRMRDKYRKYRAMEIGYMRSHFDRLRHAVPESVATAEYHQELMEQLVRIASHATNIARVLLEEDTPGGEGQPADAEPTAQAEPPASPREGGGSTGP